MFVIGDRVGQRLPVAGNRVPMPGQAGLGAHPAAGMGATGMHPGQQAAMLAAQGRNLDAAHQRQQGAGAVSSKLFLRRTCLSLPISHLDLDVL